MLDNFNIVDVLNTGVTGFAFLMLFVGYRLLSNVQSKVLERNVNDFQSIEYFREWREMVQGQLANTRYFMAFSALLFFGGVGLLVYRAESEITLSIAPSEGGVLPTILLGTDVMALTEEGQVAMKVRSGSSMLIKIDKLIDGMNRLKFESENLQRQLQGYAAVAEAQSTEAGF